MMKWPATVLLLGFLVCHAAEERDQPYLRFIEPADGAEVIARKCFERHDSL